MTGREPDVEDLLSALREDLPSDAEQARLKQRILALGIVGATSTAGSAFASTTSAAACSKATTTGLGLAGKLLATLGTTKTLVLVAAVATSAALPCVVVVTRSESPAVQSPASPVERPSIKAGRKRMRMVDAPVAPKLTVEPAPSTTTPNAPASIPAPVSKPASPRVTMRTEVQPGSLFAPTAAEAPALPSALSVESDLLLRAAQAMRNHDTETATQWLDRHAQQFPSGVLAAERELARGRLVAGRH